MVKFLVETNKGFMRKAKRPYGMVRSFHQSPEDGTLFHRKRDASNALHHVRTRRNGIEWARVVPVEVNIQVRETNEQ